MFILDNYALPKLGSTGLDGALSEEQVVVQDTLRRFARDVMRPAGQALDKLSAAQTIAAGSPLWDYIAAFRTAGILDMEALATMSPAQKAQMVPLIFEELGWGDCGLGLLGLVQAFPAFAAYMSGDGELIERFGSSIGCWVGTQPERGSDLVDMDTTELHPGSRQGAGNLTAKVEGDRVVFNGQTSSWVSGAPIAESGYVFCQCDYGDGFWNDKGGMNYIAALVPFDLPGISKGQPLEKLGQRPLPQGQVFFDGVSIPAKYVVAGIDKAYPSFLGALTFGNMEMAFTFTGVARAAFELALDYVHERRQGGCPLIEHQSVRLRIFDMWRKLEAARALARRVADYNFGPQGPHLLGSITSKTFVTQAAFEICNEAMQLLGGNGLTKEYPAEKLFRDARAALIEDGENNLLSLKGASYLSAWWKNGAGRS